MARESVRHRRRSEAILASAVSAFRQHGYHGTSMREIADTLQLTKGSLYYYFGGKADILFAAHDLSLDRMLAALEHAECGGAPPAAQLRELIVEHTRAMIDGFHGSALALELDALPVPQRQKLIAKRDRYESGLRRILRRGVRDGSFRSLDPRLSGFALLGAINWMARWYRPEGDVEPQQIGESFAALFLDGLRATPRQPARRARSGRRRNAHEVGAGTAGDPAGACRN